VDASNAIYVYTVYIYASSVFTTVGDSLDNGVPVAVFTDQATSSASPTAVSKISFLCATPYEVVDHSFINCYTSVTEAMTNYQVASAL